MDDRLSGGELLLGEKKSKAAPIATYIVIAILVAFILFYYFFGCAVVSGHSMENTLNQSQRCLLLRHGYDVDRGDIVTIEHPKPKNSGDMLVKRVIALEGDKILFVRSSTNLYVDLYLCKAGENTFKLQTENYLKEQRMVYAGSDSKFTFDVNGNVVPTAQYNTREYIENIKVNGKNNSDTEKYYLDCAIDIKKNCFYYMGDNRNHSTDARYYGACLVDKITGKVISISKKNSFLEGFLNFMFSAYGNNSQNGD